MNAWDERAARRMNRNDIDVTKAPRSWTAMLETWRGLLGSLCLVLGSGPEEQGLARHLWMWRWMWTLPPCSEARKAAWTLGATAWLIERWRRARRDPERVSWGTEEDPGHAAAASDIIAACAIGQRAEEILRRCRWHIDDAKIEASILTRRPGIPPHVRIYAYSQAVDPEHGGVNFCGVMNDSDRRRVTLAMIDDFVRHTSERKTLKPSDDALIALAPALVETLGASLPEGPWIVTSQDVWRFLAELLLEDAT